MMPEKAAIMAPAAITGRALHDVSRKRRPHLYGPTRRRSPDRSMRQSWRSADCDGAGGCRPLAALGYTLSRLLTPQSQLHCRKHTARRTAAANISTRVAGSATRQFFVAVVSHGSAGRDCKPLKQEGNGCNKLRQAKGPGRRTKCLFSLAVPTGVP